MPETNKAPVPEFVIVKSVALSMSPETVNTSPVLTSCVNLPSLMMLPETVRSPALLVAEIVPILLLISPLSDIPCEPSLVSLIEPVPSETFFTTPSSDIPSFGPYEVIEITPLSFLKELPDAPSPSMLTSCEKRSSPIDKEVILPSWSTPAIIPPLSKRFTPAALISTVSLEMTLPAMVTMPVPCESVRVLKSLYNVGVDWILPLNFS